ncbi:DUF3108 domain-containing protein [Pseudoalteromonas elyakovii]|uniref:DUF3108 domain-containing protein n=1 Tax=Pseudoalteromonas shioyasakiensis TaxID=1190813 RepID=UPI000780D159|nr:DUF3108 domain-containing protein [Pseudoalteromonas shioyasakiensis]MAG44525.1 DUF3108 domain-containing protein [bacterium]MDC3191011.1 DUF3108 domain-containing protein [Pseudoalteromonas elyakovii]
MLNYNSAIKIIILVILYFALPITAAPLIKSGSEETSELNLYTAKYSVLRGKKKYGRATRTLSKNNTSYSLSFNTSASIFFYSIDTSETSTFLWQDNKVALLSYKGKDSRTFKKEKHLQLNFDHNNQTLIAKKNGEISEQTLKDDVLDPLFVFEMLRLDALKNDGFSNVKQLHYTVYDTSGFKEFNFLNGGRVTIDTPLGELNCIKLSRIRKNSTRKTHIWLAIDYDYIPIMLLQEHKEEEVATLLISSIEKH